MKLSVVLDYLSALEQNNNRAWFHQNKTQYQAAKLEFESLVAELNTELCKADGSIPLFDPKELTFKLQRDTRFSHDKSPYNPSFRAHIGEKGKLPIPAGYYLMLRPGGRSFLGGGLFADMFKDATVMMRDAIAANGEEWERIISDPAFTKYFTVGGTRLKNVPKGYPADHPQAESLKCKSWYLEFPVPDEQVKKADFVKFAVSVFTKMQPFHAFLNGALKDFQMPTR